MYYHQPIGNIELVLIIQVILSVHEILPLGLRLFSRSGVMRKLRMGMLKVLLLPLAVFTAALDVGHEWVKRNGFVAGGVAEAEGRTELEAAMTVMGGMFPRGVRDEEEDYKSRGDVHNGRNFSHFWKVPKS